MTRSGSRRGRFHIGAALLVFLVATIETPARALPSSQPYVSISVDYGSDNNSRIVTVEASSANGTITRIDLCAPDADSCGSHGFNSDVDATTSLRQCLLGDGESYSVELHFPGPGTYVVTASATSTGCPVLGSEQTGSTTSSVEIPAEPPPPPPIVCADSGAPDASDIGVTATTIDLGSTVVSSGPDASDARFGILAAVRDVNAGGGICGRTLNVELHDDSGDRTLAHSYVQAMAQRDLALVAMPDTEGLESESSSGEFEALGIPVVGTGGFTAAEFADASVWSVGGAPDLFASTVVEHDYAQGARRFGIVTNPNVAWLAQAHDSVVAAIDQQDGASVCGDTSVDPTALSYASQIQDFDASCVDGYDAVIYLLDGVRFLTWMSGNPPHGAIEDDLTQFAMSRDVAVNCQSACDGMVVWDPFLNPVQSNADATRAYVQSIQFTNPQADPYDSATEAAYVGTYLIARAMAAAGTDLTRTRLKDVLDSQTFTDPLVGSSFAWRDQRAANRCLRGYRIRYRGTFGGWSEAAGWLCS